jgi:hypothetical protein
VSIFPYKYTTTGTGDCNIDITLYVSDRGTCGRECVCVCVYTCLCVHACMCIHARVSMRECVYVNMHVCVCACARVCVCLCVYVCVRV